MISLFDLVQPFLSCEDLAFKPKLFFFLACRGECMEFQGANEQSSEIFLILIYRVLMNSYWKKLSCDNKLYGSNWIHRL